MHRTVTTQIHFDQVDRGFQAQRQDLVGVSSDEIVDLMGSLCPLGSWRLEIETGQMFWSEDAFRIHGMAPSADAISLSQVVGRYHPDDAAMVEQLMETATTQKTGFRYVMRVHNGKGGFRLIAAAGRFRSGSGNRNELIGYYHEFQDMVRSVVLTEI